VGAGCTQTTINIMFLMVCHVWGILCFSCLWDRFGNHFCEFLGSLDDILVVRKWMQISIKKRACG
jgi:hypothetical protein